MMLQAFGVEQTGLNTVFLVVFYEGFETAELIAEARSNWVIDFVQLTERLSETPVTGRANEGPRNGIYRPGAKRVRWRNARPERIDTDDLRALPCPARNAHSHPHRQSENDKPKGYEPQTKR